MLGHMPILTLNIEQVSHYNSKRCYFIGTADFVYQRFSGPVAVYRDDLKRYTDLYEVKLFP